MLFNSIDFAIFLPVVFALYWFVFNKSVRVQNGFVVLASYFFYGYWDWRFLSLILFSTLVDFGLGRLLRDEMRTKRRKLLLSISLVVNLGFLGVFKYFNFFAESFAELFTFFGSSFSPYTLQIILPVGISFYTFQTLSYTIDVYRKKLSATNDFVAFAAFVSFFPQLVAGPIERATNLLPQFKAARVFQYKLAIDGMHQILWGLFKKMVIADNFAVFANEIFGHSDQYSGLTLLLGAVFFAFQIYGDFSGYSDIAIGTARLFGFNLMQNFAFPYFSRDIAEFWRRWHISLSTWFRDYLYIPLGGSKVGGFKKVRNIFVIFLVSGFWHGANWTFIIWGLLNALYFLPLMIRKVNRQNMAVVAQDSVLPGLKDAFNMALTFFLTTIAWVFFRAENVEHAWQYLSRMFGFLFSPNAFKDLIAYTDALNVSLVIVFAVFMGVEWLGRRQQYGLQFIFGLAKPWRIVIVVLLIFMVLYFMATGEQNFIYFQF